MCLFEAGKLCIEGSLLKIIKLLIKLAHETQATLKLRRLELVLVGNRSQAQLTISTKRADLKASPHQLITQLILLYASANWHRQTEIPSSLVTCIFRLTVLMKISWRKKTKNVIIGAPAHILYRVTKPDLHPGDQGVYST